MTDTFLPRRAPDSGTPRDFEPRTLDQQFGDGYEASASVGINADLRNCSPSWKNLRQADAQYIIDFLGARKGTIHFYWRPNGPNQPLQRFKCKKFTYKWKRGNFCDIDAEFQQMGM